MLLLATAAAAPIVAATTQEGGFTNVTVAGNGVATQTDETVYLWQNNASRLHLELDPFEPGTYHTLCFGIENGTSGPGQQIKCRVQDLNRGNRVTTFDLGPVVENRLGPHRLNATLKRKSRVARTALHVTVITRNGDLDGDTLTNEKEIRLGTGLNDTDTDTDGLPDAAERNKYGTNPLENDTDQDGLRDAMEIQRGTNATNPDTDGDGLADGDEVHVHGTSPVSADSDGDGLTDRAELERYGTNPKRTDTDGDRLSDSTELRKHETNPLDPDTDADGIRDGREVALNRNPREPSMFESMTQPTEPLFLAVAFVGAVVLTLGGVSSRYAYARILDDDDDTTGAEAPSVSPDAPHDEDAVDPELLSPEERVLHLVEQNGGRIKQSDIVEYTSWSKAKVSRTLSEMDEEGTIQRTRIGRENVVSVPEEEPKAA